MPSLKNSRRVQIVAEDTLLEDAKNVLNGNLLNGLVIPAQGLYPHQVLWDSCFIAIGLSHYNLKQAQDQIESFLNAQWQNGMVPHIIFNQQPKYWWDRRIWRSWISPLAPPMATSGLTQPPLLAEAIIRVGSKLNEPERLSWYKSVYPKLLNYHEWLYAERDPQQTGLILLLHPWESGLDNTPPWLESLRHHHAPWWLNMMVWFKLDKVADHFRLDSKYVDFHQRSSTVEALRLYDALRRIRKKRYDTKKILKRPPFAIADLTFNCIFIRANSLLEQIAQEIGETLPADVNKRVEISRSSLENLWDEAQARYFCLNHKSNNFLKEDSVAGLLPLYSGAITKTRAKQLAAMLGSSEDYDVPYPIPSVPPSSRWFKPMKYWQGPSWININWLIIDGLRRYGLDSEADKLTRKSIELVRTSGFYEYYNPLSAEPAGVKNFSWTAALIIDLLHTQNRN